MAKRPLSVVAIDTFPGAAYRHFGAGWAEQIAGSARGIRVIGDVLAP